VFGLKKLTILTTGVIVFFSVLVKKLTYFTTEVIVFFMGKWAHKTPHENSISPVLIFFHGEMGS
jgi:hypothetical protein